MSKLHEIPHDCPECGTSFVEVDPPSDVIPADREPCDCGAGIHSFQNLRTRIDWSTRRQYWRCTNCEHEWKREQ